MRQESFVLEKEVHDAADRNTVVEEEELGFAQRPRDVAVRPQEGDSRSRSKRDCAFNALDRDGKSHFCRQHPPPEPAESPQQAGPPARSSCSRRAVDQAADLDAARDLRVIEHRLLRRGRYFLGGVGAARGTDPRRRFRRSRPRTRSR